MPSFFIGYQCLTNAAVRRIVSTPPCYGVLPQGSYKSRRRRTLRREMPVPLPTPLLRASVRRCEQIRGAHIQFENRDDSRSLVIITHKIGSPGRPFIVRYLDDPGPVQVTLQTALYSTDPTVGRFSWCLNERKLAKALPACNATMETLRAYFRLWLRLTCSPCSYIRCPLHVFYYFFGSRVTFFAHGARLWEPYPSVF